jgi:hypothetical protein
VTSVSGVEWLPPLARVSGDWALVIQALYAVFDSDFKKGRPQVRGTAVWWDQRVLPGEIYEEAFWHLITRDDPEHGRIPDFPRAERLPWSAPVITHADNPAVTTWMYREGRGNVRMYVWLHDHDYVAVLQPRPHRGGTVLFLVTAYHVDGDWSRRSLRRKYDQRLE